MAAKSLATFNIMAHGTIPKADKIERSKTIKHFAAKEPLYGIIPSI